MSDMTPADTAPDRTIQQVAGQALDLIRAGSGQPLLFLHSGPSPVYDSGPFVNLLARDFAVVAPCHPGLGRLNRPPEFELIDDLAYYYLDAVAELGLRGAPVVAASVGGWIAAEMAIRDPAVFSRLVLVNPLGLRRGAPTDRPIADIWSVPREERRRIQFARAEFQAEDLAARSDEELLELARFEENLSRYAWKPYLHNPLLPRWLKRIGAPALVLRGAEDRFVAASLHEAFAAGLPQGRLELVAGAGHHPHVECPVETARIVADFLREA